MRPGLRRITRLRLGGARLRALLLRLGFGPGFRLLVVLRFRVVLLRDGFRRLRLVLRDFERRTLFLDLDRRVVLRDLDRRVVFLDLDLRLVLRFGPALSIAAQNLQ